MRIYHGSGWKTLVLGAAVVLGGLVGCGDEVGQLDDGSLAVSWEVSPKGCKDSGVSEVEVMLTNALHTYQDRVLCERGEALLGGIYPGNYHLHVRGLDKSAQVTFAAAQKSVTVRDAKIETVGRMRLTAKPADVEVGWMFKNGRVCGANGVERVEVIVYDDKGYEVASAQFRCNEGSGVVDGLPAGDYVVEVSAEVSGKTAFVGKSDLELDRGDSGQVDVVLNSK